MKNFIKLYNKSMCVCVCAHACIYQSRNILQIQNNGASAFHCGLYSIKDFHLWRQLMYDSTARG